MWNKKGRDRGSGCELAGGPEFEPRRNFDFTSVSLKVHRLLREDERYLHLIFPGNEHNPVRGLALLALYATEPEDAREEIRAYRKLLISSVPGIKIVGEELLPRTRIPPNIIDSALYLEKLDAANRDAPTFRPDQKEAAQIINFESEPLLSPAPSIPTYENPGAKIYYFPPTF